MKTSKKILSLFLALVMVITTCSVGFTAFAEDSSDAAKKALWNANYDKEETYENVTNLINTFVPQIANAEKVKGLLEGIGVSVNENTSISDIVAGVSPLLLKTFNNGNEEGIITGFYQEKGYSEAEAKKMYKNFSAFGMYDYLKDDNAVVDFFSLYRFCEDNWDSDDSKKKNFAQTTLPQLKDLLQKHLDAFKALKSENGGEDVAGTKHLKDYKNQVTLTFDENLTLYDLENFEIGGTKLKDINKTDHDCDTKISYDNMYLDFEGAPFQIDNIASALFYQYNEKYVMGIFYLYLATLGGATVKYNDKQITVSNYKSVIGESKSYSDFCTEKDFEQDDRSASAYDSYCLNEVYNTIFDGSTQASKIESKNEFASPYYSAMAIGALEATNSYDSTTYKNATEFVKAQQVSDDQIKDLYAHVKNGWTFYDYLNSDEECKFSEYSRKFYLDWLYNYYASQMVEYNLGLCADENEAIEVFRKIALANKFEQFGEFYDTDGDDILLMYFDEVYPSDDATPFNDIANYMLPSVIIQKLAGKTDATFGFPGTANIKFFYEDYNSGKLVKENIGDEKYEYDEHKIDPDMALDVVNTTINGFLNYLDPNAVLKIGGMNIPIGQLINDVLKKLLITDITTTDLQNALTDVWKNLYEDPIGTVIKLVPTVVTLLDEVVLPLVLNSNSPEDSELYQILAVNMKLIDSITQDADNTKVGLGTLSFDLNKTVPAILYWLTGNEDIAVSLVGTYDEYAEGVDTRVPVFTNIYAADKALFGAHLNGGLAKTLKNGALKDSPEVADILDEFVTVIAEFALDAVNEYLKDYDYSASDANQPDKYKRYNANGDISQVGLNNLFVALPEVLDIMGKNFTDSYGIDSDWTLLYKIVSKDDDNKTNGKVYKHNTILEDFKAYATSSNAKPEDIFDSFVKIFIEEWFNPIIDILNDTIQDDDSKFASSFGIIQKLLKSLGGFSESSIISNVLNGFFQLDNYDEEEGKLFSFSERAHGFVGLGIESGRFLLSNILFIDGGEQKGLIPFIKDYIEAKKEASSDDNNNNNNDDSSSSDNNSGSSTSPTIDNSSKIKRTPASELLTNENKKAAKSLVDSLDKLLSSLLKNTTLNDFSLDKTDNILYGVVTTASNYLGASNTNEIVKLVDKYLSCILYEDVTGFNDGNEKGILPKNNDVDAKDVYTPQNLSVLVVQTYSVAEKIIEYVLFDTQKGLLKNKNTYMLLSDEAIQDAINRVIAPDSVYKLINNHIEAGKTNYDYSGTIDVLKGKYNWSDSFSVDYNTANEHKNSANVLKFKFDDGDKNAFYDGLGETLSGVAGIIGALLTSTNYYGSLVKPLFEVLGAENIMDADKFASSTESQQLIQGIIAPLASSLNKLYKAPASSLLMLIRNAAAYLDDNSIKKIVDIVLAPIYDFANGLPPTTAIVITSKLDEIPKKLGSNIIVSALNSIKAIQKYVVFPNIDWANLASCKSPEEVLLLIYGYAVDTVFGSPIISGLINSLAPGITDIFTKLTPAEILRIVSELIGVVKSPTEVYWTFSEYAGKITKKFVYPTGILGSEANKAVDQLDDIVANVFPLLNELGVTDIEGLSEIINDNLYTNEILTTIAKALYGALSKGTVADVLGYVQFDVSPKGYAAYLTDKSYGKTYSSAAATLKKAKSWDDVKSLNWGFKNGSSKAETGFINGLAAILRPLNNVLAVLLKEGKLDSSKLDVEDIIYQLAKEGSTEILKNTEYAATLTYKLKDGLFTLTVVSKAAEKDVEGTSNTPKTSVLKIDIKKITDGLNNLINDPNFGTNGYESAVIPILEAFMCKNVKTYKQYNADYKKAKDNLLIDILKPVFGLVDDIANNPFDTVTKILPNVAYFIDSNGVSQAVGNLLAPLTAKDGILGVLKDNGIDVDDIIKTIFGKPLGKILTETLGLKKVKLNLDFNNLAAANLQDIVVPLAQSLLKSKLGLNLPTFDFETIASHGTIKTVKSAAKNSKGKYTTKQVKARQGEVLVAVLRYVSDVLIKNAKPLKKLITNIDAIKKNDTIKNIVSCVFNQMAAARKDDIVRAVFYFLTERTTDSFFDYRNFKYKDGYTFSFGNMDEDFCRQLAPMLDGLVGGLLEGGLGGLVEEKLYTDSLVAKLATALYGAIEGVNINDNIGSLTNLLAMTGIDFSTSNVASLLTNSKYGLTYPAAASVIRSAGSWSKVNADSLKFGVTDRDSFLNALVSVLRPLYGVLDVILNDASLNIFNLVKIPGSDGYTSTIVPLLEAFGVYNIKTQYQYREDCYEAYDCILLDIINPLWDKVEDILNAPVEMLADILPNLSLFFANDGLLQIVDNLFTPISALLQAIRPIVDVNAILKAAGLDVAKLLKDKVGLNLPKFDLYDLPGTLKPLVGANNVVGTLNSILGKIKIKGTPLGIVLPDIDWFKLASHGDFVPNATSQAATYGGRIAVIADQDETLIAVLRFVIDTINYKDNYDAIVNLITGILGDSVSDSISDVISQVLGMLKGDSDEVIEQLVDLLKQFA